MLVLSPASARRAACCKASVHLTEAGAEAAGRAELVCQTAQSACRQPDFLPPGCPLLTAKTIVAAPCCSTSLPAPLPRRCVASAVRHASLITPVSSALDEARKSTLRCAVAPTFGGASGASGARAGLREQRARRLRRGSHGAASVRRVSCSREIRA